MTSAPCVDCKSRYIGCHQTCKEYLAWKDARSAIHSKRRKVLKEESMLNRYIVDASLKNTKKKKRDR